MDTAFAILFEFILVWTGQFAIFVLTLGRWRGASDKEASVGGPAGALTFVRDGRRFVTSTGHLFAGVLFYVAAIVLVVAVVA